MRKLLISILFLVGISAEAQKVVEKQVYFTVLHADGSGVDALTLADIRAPDGVQFTSIEKLVDTPIQFALLLDNSGSRRGVLAAQKQLGNLLLEKVLRDGKDTGMVVNFNEEPYVDQMFTTDSKALSKAIDKSSAKGGSAIFDAVVATANYFKAHTIPDTPQVAIIISDGGDNASRDDERQAIAALQRTAVRVYSFQFGSAGSDHETQRGIKILQHLAAASGGRSFLIPPGKSVSISNELATLRSDLKSWYRVTCRIPEKFGERAIPIEASAPALLVSAPANTTKIR